MRGLKQAGIDNLLRVPSSHPTWVRGLKLDVLLQLGIRLLSHPTWVRGLKPVTLTEEQGGEQVAPYVGAWIETSIALHSRGQSCVAPYVGAWIETPLKATKSQNNSCRTLRGCVD